MRSGSKAKPSKPPVCRSRTLTPAPEPARYCAAMSQENIETVRRITEALDRRNWDAVFAAMSSDFEWETDPRHPRAGVYRGREEFKRFIEDLEDPFEQTVTEIEKVFATADQVVAFVRIRRRLRGSTPRSRYELARSTRFAKATSS